MSSTLSLWSIAEVLERPADLPEAARAALVTTAEWARSYLLRGHPQLGRTGPVCPWCPPSVQRGHFWLAHLPVRADEPEGLVGQLGALRDQYLAMAPTGGPDLSLKTIVCALEHEGGAPSGTALESWMGQVHARAKPGFLSRGLMLGEFFEGNPKGGLRNESFRPLCSPIPLFVIRDMVALDVTFLSDQREHMEAYFAKFGAEATRNIREILHISPKRLSRTMLRSVLGSLVWYDLQTSHVDGVDLVTGANVKHLGYSRLRQVLDEDRTFRPMTAVVVLEPKGLGDAVSVDSLTHLEWLWRNAHELRRALGNEDFMFRDGPRLVAVVRSSQAEDIAQITDFAGADGENLPGVITGCAVESVLDAHAAEWEWDGSEHTSASELLGKALADLESRRAATSPAKP